VNLSGPAIIRSEEDRGTNQIEAELDTHFEKGSG
jgi:hypothetical protein